MGLMGNLGLELGGGKEGRRKAKLTWPLGRWSKNRPCLNQLRFNLHISFENSLEHSKKK